MPQKTRELPRRNGAAADHTNARKKRPYRSIVEAQHAKPRTKRQRKPAEHARPQFLRFMVSSASCSLLDQVLAWVLFSALRKPMSGAGFLRILVSNVLARCISLTLNYSLNHRLVFSIDVDDPEWQRSARRESLPRFITLSAIVLALSTLGVFIAHTYFAIPEWKAKVAVDVALFFLNYNVQRTWVFKNEVSVSPKHIHR